MKDLSKEEMDKILTTVGDGVLALSSGDKPYCIPFGFVYIEGKVYLSMFPRGRKWKIYQENKKVCFNVFAWNKDHTEWLSVVIDGEMVPVKDLKEIESVVKANIEKLGMDSEAYLQKRMAVYKKSMDTPAALKIFRIETEQINGKKMKTLIGE